MIPPSSRGPSPARSPRSRSLPRTWKPWCATSAGLAWRTCSPPTGTPRPSAWCGRTTPRARPGTSSPRRRSSSGEYPALSDIAPAAFVEECEIYEQFGIRPATGKPLNRIMLPAARRPADPRPQAAAKSRKRPTPRTPWAGRRSSSRSARSARSASSRCTTAWSPAARKSSTCTCSPGTSTAAWNGGCGARPREQALFLAERTEGLSAVALGWAFAAAAEAATGTRLTRGSRSAPAPSRSSWSGCTTTPPPWRRCASRPGCPSASPPPRSPWNGCSG